VFLATALVVSIAFPVATRAVTVADKRAQAARLKAEVDAQAERIAAADRKLRLASYDVHDADARMRSAQARVEAAQAVLVTARRRLASRAVNAYVHGGQVSFVEQIVASATRKPSNPEGFDIHAPFRLPYSVNRVRLETARAFLDF